MVDLGEDEMVIADFKVRGGKVYITDRRLIIVEGSEERGVASAHLEELKSVELRVNWGPLAMIVLGVSLALFGVIAQNTCVVSLPGGSTCIKIGILLLCPQESITAVSCLETWWLTLLALPLIWYGYSRLWRLDVVTKRGTFSVVSDKKTLEELELILEQFVLMFMMKKLDESLRRRPGM